MRAIVFTAYGSPDVLRVMEKATPHPRDNEVLIKVYAASVNALEWRPFTFPKLALRLIAGFRAPRDQSLGVDVAGRVEAVGPGVTQFRPGDDVFGTARGAFAEYVCTAEHKLVAKPAHVSFEAAAAVPVAGLTALQAVRRHGCVRAGQRVLVHGAGGGVGTFAVQIAKALGADVTAVCGTGNVDVARASGADHVIDYTREDFATRGHRYDVVIVANGNRAIRDYVRVLTPRGTAIVLGGAITQLLRTLLAGPVLALFSTKRIRGMLTSPNPGDLLFLKELLETGRIVPAIDRCYPLAEVPDAIRYLLEGHPRGKVVITNT
jgi:NADPH:quinone reductase-like Zn-dependent oxidoreductase